MSDPMRTNETNAEADIQHLPAVIRVGMRPDPISSSSQPAELQTTAAVDEATTGSSPSFTAQAPLCKTLEECIPMYSDTVLGRVVSRRLYDSRATTSLIHDGDNLIQPSLADVWAHVDKLKPSEHSILMIEDIDSKWCEALCARYPKLINQTFLLEHILGLRLNEQWSVFPSQDEFELLGRGIASDLERINQAMPWLRDPTSIPGQHIDVWEDEECPEFRRCSIGGCELVKLPSGWIKINGFLSHCQLQDNVCKYT
jgi:hypothetical protein